MGKYAEQLKGLAREGEAEIRSVDTDIFTQIIWADRVGTFLYSGVKKGAVVAAPRWR
jgi:hypothetical protein